MADHADEQYGDFEDYDAAKPAYSKVIVATCLVLVLAFTVTCLVFYWNGKPVDQVLIGFFFACFGIEFASLAFIKGREVRYVEGSPANRQVGHVEVKEEEDE